MNKCRINIKGNCDDELVCHCEGCYNNIEMKNIFENAKFGDKFVCTNNKVGILVCCCEITGIALLMFADNYETYFDYSIKKYRLDGVCVSDRIKYDEFDIMSKYQYSINEEELDELSENWNINYALHPHMEDYEEYNRNDVVEAFKYGYRKAMEE